MLFVKCRVYVRARQLTDQAALYIPLNPEPPHPVRVSGPPSRSYDIDVEPFLYPSTAL